jgi:protocatechuate 3,4-dioxygenase beta subunit
LGEYDFRTDPHSRDTDNDGLSDFFELTTFYNYTTRPDNGYEGLKRSSPIDPDTDGGGMIDGLEVNLSLDPLDPRDDDEFLDNDNDGLTNGQERNLQGFDPKDPKNNNVDWDGDGRPDGHTDPNDPDTDDDGLTDGGEYLSRRHRTNPLSNDTDRDGIDDRTEVELLGTDPTNSDTDSDGISDLQEITIEYNVSFVDWDMDGRIDYKTDPINRDTDLDSIYDGNEVMDDTPTNPLDPGDPGIELLPEETPFIFINKAPITISKEEDPLEGAFQVSGIVRDGRGDPIEGIGVSILVVGRDTDKERALILEMNQAYRVGSIDSTREDGSYTISCIPNEETPFGEVFLYAVTRQGNLDGRRYVQSVSAPRAAILTSDSRFDIERDELFHSLGGVVLVKGRIIDIGGLPVPDAEIVLAPGFNSPISARSNDNGHFTFLLNVPKSEGIWEMQLDFDGNSYLSPSNKTIILSITDGPVIDLEGLPDTLVAGDLIYINGTITGGPSAAQGNVNITFIHGDGLREIAILSGVISGSTFSLPVTLTPSKYIPGEYLITVSFDLGDGTTSVNSSLRFQLIDVTSIVVPETTVVKGENPFLFINLQRGDGEPVSNAIVSMELPNLPQITPLPVRTNETGWAVFLFEIDTSVPLGITPMRIIHRVSNGNVIPATWEGNLRIQAPVSIVLEDQEADLVLLQGLILEGRVLDDEGTGIDGLETLEVILNGDSLGFSSTNDGGWFRINEIVPQFTRLGDGLLILRFNGLTDERSEWYPEDQIGIRVNVRSRTYISMEENLHVLNSSITLTLRDERGDPISNAPLRVGINIGFDTYITGPDGNLTIDLGDIEPDDDINIEFPGDPERSLLPSNLTRRVPSNQNDEDGINISVILSLLAIISLIIVSAFLITRLLRLRKDLGARKAIEKRDSSIYPFEPRSDPQRMLVQTYKETLEDFNERGVARPLNMTPDEFRDVVLETSGEFSQLSKLTDIFDEARYSDHTVSSHLLGQAKEMKNAVRKAVEKMDPEVMREAIRNAMKSKGVELHRPMIWKMQVDHTEELKELLGKKEVDDR